METPEVTTGYHIVLDAAGRQGHMSIERWSVVIDGWDEDGDIDSLRARFSTFLHNRSLVVQPELEVSEYVQRAAHIISVENCTRFWPRRPKWLNKIMYGSQVWPPAGS